MAIKSNPKNQAKSLSPNQSKLIVGLYEIGKSTFHLDDAEKITGLCGQSLSNFIHALVNKGILTRLGSGLYNIVPFELGHTREHMGNQFVVAREIIKQKLKREQPEYYISHGSAMDIHQMVTQPQLVVYATVTKQIKQNPTILGTEFRFVTCKSDHYFGIKKFWVEKSQQIIVSNIEKTIIDGLKMPEYCGGIIEVVKGFWMKRDEVNITWLVDYAMNMDVGAIYRRLGHLLEVFQIDCPEQIERLQSKLTKTYVPLDPGLLDEGKYSSRWRLRLNIVDKELLAIVRT